MKHVTSGGAHLRALAAGLQQLRWRAVGETVSDFTSRGIKPQTSRADSNVFTHYPYQPMMT